MDSNLGLFSSIDIPCPGVIPQVTVGAISVASKMTSSSKIADELLARLFHQLTAFSQSSSLRLLFVKVSFFAELVVLINENLSKN